MAIRSKSSMHVSPCCSSSSNSSSSKVQMAIMSSIAPRGRVGFAQFVSDAAPRHLSPRQHKILAPVSTRAQVDDDTSAITVQGEPDTPPLQPFVSHFLETCKVQGEGVSRSEVGTDTRALPALQPFSSHFLEEWTWKPCERVLQIGNQLAHEGQNGLEKQERQEEAGELSPVGQARLKLLDAVNQHTMIRQHEISCASSSTPALASTAASAISGPVNVDAFGPKKAAFSSTAAGVAGSSRAGAGVPGECCSGEAERGDLQEAAGFVEVASESIARASTVSEAVTHFESSVFFFYDS